MDHFIRRIDDKRNGFFRIRHFEQAAEFSVLHANTDFPTGA